MATAIEFENAGKQPYEYRPDREECQAIFIASCVENAASVEKISPEEMYERMRNVNLIEDYILPCYDVLHTESRNNVTQDVLQTLKTWEKKKFGKL